MGDVIDKIKGSKLLHTDSIHTKTFTELILSLNLEERKELIK
jgi:hypothetical protein